jgi:hypothetical protein
MAILAWLALAALLTVLLLAVATYTFEWIDRYFLSAARNTDESDSGRRDDLLAK